MISVGEYYCNQDAVKTNVGWLRVSQERRHFHEVIELRRRSNVGQWVVHGHMLESCPTVLARFENVGRILLYSLALLN